MVRLLRTLVAMTAGILVVPAVASAQIDEVRIVVSGLTCNFCAAGLERSLRKVAAVSSVRVSVQDETALVTVRKGAQFDADRLRAAVTDAGQETRLVELRVRGAVREHDGAYTVEASPGVLLAFGHGSSARLQPYAGRTVRVKARVSSPVRSPLQLDLVSIE